MVAAMRYDGSDGSHMDRLENGDWLGVSLVRLGRVGQAMRWWLADAYGHRLPWNGRSPKLCSFCGRPWAEGARESVITVPPSQEPFGWCRSACEQAWMDRDFGEYLEECKRKEETRWLRKAMAAVRRWCLTGSLDAVRSLTEASPASRTSPGSCPPS